jgi:DNA-binding GntR family transcriptional regulator
VASLTSNSLRADGAASQISVLRPDSLREQVTRALEAAIVAGELLPGVIYSAPGLAERFGVSATPVREAMLDLVKEGFVEPLRNRGFRVIEMSDEDLDDIAQIRLLIEVPTISQIASLLTPSRVENLAVAAEAIERAAAHGDVLEYLDSDRRFHVELISAIGNARLTDLVDRLRRQARLFGLKDLAKSGRLMASAREHRMLLDALSVRDIRAAKNLMRAHIGHTRGLWAGRQDRA